MSDDSAALDYCSHTNPQLLMARISGNFNIKDILPHDYNQHGQGMKIWIANTDNLPFYPATACDL